MTTKRNANPGKPNIWQSESHVSPQAATLTSPAQFGGLFAIGRFRPGDVVYVMAGLLFAGYTAGNVSPAGGRRAIQVAENLFLGPANPEGSVFLSNHSCNPNIGLQGQIVFVALRDIAPGEELTHDWAMIDDCDYAITCECGTAECRRTITGKDWRRKDLQQKYRGLFSWYLEQKIEAGNTDFRGHAHTDNA